MSKHVLDTASDKRLYHESIQLMNSLPEPERIAFESTDPILKDYKENKGRYNLKNLPPIYSLHNFDMHDFVPGIGHQLFLGVTETIFSDLLGKYLRHAKVFFAFVARFNEILNKINLLKIPFLRIPKQCGYSQQDQKIALTGWKYNKLLALC